MFLRSVNLCCTFSTRHILLLGVRSKMSRNTSSSSTVKRSTAGIIIIGNEILRGDVQDSNSYHLCQELYRVGIQVSKVSVIPDEVDIIAQEVRQFSDSYDFVLTTGGIGPTHDDITYEGVAKGLGLKLHVDPELRQLCQEYFKRPLEENKAVLKFATVPEESRVLFCHTDSGKRVNLPLVSVKNVYIFPGVPKILTSLVPAFLGEYSTSAGKLHSSELFFKTDEISLTPALDEAVEKFKGMVSFGSYPVLDQAKYKVRIVIEGRSDAQVRKAAEYLLSKVPSEAVAYVDRSPLEKPWKGLSTFMETNPYIKEAVNFVEQTLKSYSIPEICVAFSGGKDCTAVLHMVHACVENLFPDQNFKLQMLFIDNGRQPTEIVGFVHSSAKMYNAELLTFPGPVKEACSQLLATRPGIKVCFMGNRSTDPGSAHLEHLTPTDNGWPPLLRAFPILTWSYQEVWRYIRDLYIPYCTLYDQGYSSIGDNCSKNEALHYIDSDGIHRYKPAYLLINEKLERSNR